MNFGLQTLVHNQLESIHKVEERIRKAKSVKDFVEANRDNKEILKAYSVYIQPTIDKINNVIRNTECARKKIKINRIASKEVIKGYIEDLQKSIEIYS